LQGQDFEALKKACLYSIPPNRLGYCGPKDSFTAFQKFLSSPTEEKAANAKTLLSQFSALYPYLELIAKANKRKPFDLEVVEAYWLGNSLLEKVSYKQIQETILSLQKHGLPKSIAEKKTSQLPEEMLPHHSFHVLFVNFISQNVKPIVQNLSACLVQWAEVEENTNNGVRVKGVELFSESNELKLREKEKIVENPSNLQLFPKDLITVHWQNAIEKISSQGQKNLKNLTERTLALL